VIGQRGKEGRACSCISLEGEVVGERREPPSRERGLAAATARSHAARGEEKTGSLGCLEDITMPATRVWRRAPPRRAREGTGRDRGGERTKGISEARPSELTQPKWERGERRKEEEAKEKARIREHRVQASSEEGGEGEGSARQRARVHASSGEWQGGEKRREKPRASARPEPSELDRRGRRRGEREREGERKGRGERSLGER